MKKRRTGILLPVASLPGGHGIGDLGPAARQWIDHLQSAGASLWQICPLSSLGFGNSPYHASSAFGSHYLYISLEDLIREGLLQSGELDVIPPFNPAQAAYQESALAKLALLQTAWSRFKENDHPLKPEFSAFQKKNRVWLAPHSLFFVLKDQYGGAPWWEWEPRHRNPTPAALRSTSAQFQDRVQFYEFLQFLFHRQWTALKNFADGKGVRIIGDVAFYPAHDSVDVWANQEFFTLTSEGRRASQAGVPPDGAHPKGQAWGAPLYQWTRMKKNRYAWWMARVRQALTQFDYVRLDHFSGFFNAFSVHGEASHGRFGKWIPGPGLDFLQPLVKQFGSERFIVEDLGIHSSLITSALESLGLSGTKIIQFAFDADPLAESNRLYRIHPETALYTGTHDNPTLETWIASTGKNGPPAGYWGKMDLEFYAGTGNGRLRWDLIRVGMESPARFFILPLADIQGLGSEARINTPGKDGGNWEWRADETMMTGPEAEKFKSLAATFGRLP